MFKPHLVSPRLYANSIRPVNTLTTHLQKNICCRKKPSYLYSASPEHVMTLSLSNELTASDSKCYVSLISWSFFIRPNCSLSTLCIPLFHTWKHWQCFYLIVGRWMSVSMEAKVKSKRCVFTCFLKVATEMAECTNSGRLFHTGGAQEWKLLHLCWSWP